MDLERNLDTADSTGTAYAIIDANDQRLAGPFATWRLAACKLDDIRRAAPGARIRLLTPCSAAR